MNNSIVIHLRDGAVDIASNPTEESLVVIDFNKYAALPNMGSKHIMIECPKCQQSGSQMDWNVATCDDFGGPDTDFTRIQHAEADFQFTCAYCYEVSTTEELGSIPTEPEVEAPDPEKSSDGLKCPKCLSDIQHNGRGYIEFGKWNGTSYELEGTVHQYSCLNPTCSKEFYL
jgi:hypothetical protein